MRAYLFNKDRRKLNNLTISYKNILLIIWIFTFSSSVLRIWCLIVIINSLWMWCASVIQLQTITNWFTYHNWTLVIIIWPLLTVPKKIKKTVKDIEFQNTWNLNYEVERITEIEIFIFYLGNIEYNKKTMWPWHHINLRNRQQP